MYDAEMDKINRHSEKRLCSRHGLFFRAEKKLITEAKALLMERNHMTEEEAHRYLQKTSMDNGTSLVETAEMIFMLMRI